MLPCNLFWRFKGGHHIEIQMRELQITEIFGEKTEFTAGPALAMAHRMVPGMECLPKGIG
jgi:hypothetical protein